MSGALWALTAGFGFGLFQTVNRQAIKSMDVYLATFLQLLVSAVVLVLISLMTEDLDPLWNASAAPVINFSLAGFFHFFIGWTFLNASQKKIGAARTTSLIGTTPLFAAVFAALTLGEFPVFLAVIGILIIVAGVYLVNAARLRKNPSRAGAEAGASGWRSLLYGLAAAVCWSISPIFIRYGLAELDSPILGVTVGVTASALGFVIVLVYRSMRKEMGTIPLDAFSLKLLAGLLVGLSTWARWIALDLTAVATVLALSLISVPIVNFLSPIVVGRDLEQVTGQVWLGSFMIIGGSLILISLR